MALTGVILRRNYKDVLIQDPPLSGELVFAIDTEEYGALESGNVVWRKHIDLFSNLSDVEIIDPLDEDLIVFNGTSYVNTQTLKAFRLENATTTDFILNVSTVLPVDIYSFDTSQFRTNKVVIQIHDTITNDMHSTELLIMTDGVEAYITDYGTLVTSVNLAQFSTKVVDNNVVITAEQTSPNLTTYRIINTLIKI